MEPGIYFGIPFSEYQKIDAVNSSSLKNMLVSPLNYKYMLDNPKVSTSTMDVGRAAHTAILEPDSFDGIYTVYDDIRKGKAWDLFKEQNDDKEIITRSELEKVEQIKLAVARHAGASEIINECDNEVTAIFVEPSTGILCKVRIDSLDKVYRYFADLKTSLEIDKGPFGRQNANLMYHFQYGFYRMALHVLTGVWVPAKCIAAQSTPPFDTVVYRVPQDAADKGMSLAIDCLIKLKECRDNDSWPGIAEDEIDLEFPAYIYDHEEEEIE